MGRPRVGDSEAAASGLRLLHEPELCLRNVNQIAAELCYLYGYQDESG